MGARVGPWRIERFLARGGMGEVWAGVHVPTGEPAAFKLLTRAVARLESFRAAFRNEVRAVASLDHPGIVRVLDHGELPEPLGEIPTGAPFLAMELARGTLADHPAATWSDVDARVRATLSALGHAHARGIIHRDLKPQNLLVARDGGIRLADFGIAWSGEGGSGERVSGTPRYMAPEQIVASWRDHGPWTDVYALAGVVWEWVCGAPLWVGTPAEVRRAHLAADPPRLRPRVAVPSGLEALLLRWLARDPRDRPRSVAHALASWDALGAELSGEVGAATVAEPVETVSTGWSDTSTQLEWLRPVEASEVVEPPIPVDPPVDGGRGLDAWGAGLGLYAWREVPLAGRESERAALWRAFRTGDPRIAVIRGAAGCGKSRLARWISESAAEAGAAVWRAAHSPGGGPSDGLASALRRELHLAGLDGEAEQRRLDQWLGARGEAASTALRDAVPEAARLAAWEAILGDSPGVFWLDDVQWGLESIHLATRLAARPGRHPLLVLTVSEEALADRPVESDALAELSAMEAVDTISLGPLPAEAHRALVGRLLGLDQVAAVRVEERTRGNPLLAVQLVGDWVRRGNLVLGSRGFAPAPGASLDLPDDLHALWAGRIAALPAADLDALRVAAVLGGTVLVDEWVAACAEAGVPAVPLERWLADGLIVGAAPEVEWEFAHGLLRESLLRETPPDVRASLHGAAARSLAGRAGVAERLGHHLVAAGRGADAVDPLLEAAYARQIRGEARLAEALYAEREEAARSLAEADPRRADGWLRLSGLLRNAGRWDEAEALVERSLSEAAAQGWPRVEAMALTHRTTLEAGRGRFAAAEAAGRASVALWERIGDPAGHQRALLGLGEALLEQQRWTAAEEALTTAIALGEDPVVGAEARRQLGHALIRSGRLEEARGLILAAVAQNRELWNRNGVGNCLADLGAIAHLQAKYAEAAGLYGEAERELRASGSDGDAIFPAMNAVTVRILSGEPPAELVEPARALLREVPVDRPIPRMLVDLIAAFVGLDRAASLRRAEEAMDRTPYVDPDLAMLLEKIADDSGDPVVAARLRTRAAALWRACRAS
jgi:tetratricopeptide (TPR) repeat protein